MNQKSNEFISGETKAIVTSDKICWEIPIETLITAFSYSPDNPSEDGEHYVEIKENKKQEFAKFVAYTMIRPYDTETGLSILEAAIDKVFMEVFEGYETFAFYPHIDKEDEE